MFDYRKIEETDTTVEYEYSIEGDPNNTGRIRLDVSTGNGYPINHTDSINHIRYASKLISYLEKCISSGSIPESGTYMWY